MKSVVDLFTRYQSSSVYFLSANNIQEGQSECPLYERVESIDASAYSKKIKNLQVGQYKGCSGIIS